MLRNNFLLNITLGTCVKPWLGEEPKVRGQATLALLAVEHGQRRVLQRARELNKSEQIILTYEVLNPEVGAEYEIYPTF